MLLHWILLAQLSGFAATETPAEEGAKASRPFQGTWNLVALRGKNGKRETLPRRTAFYYELTVRGNQVAIVEGGTTIGSWKLDPSRPVLRHPEGGQAPCELKDGALVVNQGALKKGPAFFFSPDEYVVLEFHMEKEADPDVRRLREELKRFQGTWSVLYIGEAKNAGKAGGENGAGIRIIIAGRSLRITKAGRKIDTGALWINPAGAPKRIILGTNGMEVEGEYEIKEGVLTVRYDMDSDEPRVMRLRRMRPK